MEKRAYPLERLTSLRVGGPADRLVFPESEAELRDVLASASDEGLYVRALGGGKNLLVDDRGIGGVVISLRRLAGLRFRGDLAIAGAGLSLPRLLGRTVAMSLGGLECLAGIPGTVGGAVRMNAGGAHGAIGDRVAWVRALTRTGEPLHIDRRTCGFGYRKSGLCGLFITEVALRLEPRAARLRSRIREIFESKRATQPLSAASAGCLFKNPHLPGGESAGWLLDRVGVKGLARGGAVFSTRHANFLTNRGGATFKDMTTLIAEAHRRVLERYGVDLAMEVEIWRRDEDRALRAE
ncbi:MAG: UDP-N-acetylmuramate dehydrogenase [Planctomycetota bacterium]|jgi:UDP-N-acetylmuramate dehydrogenase